MLCLLTVLTLIIYCDPLSYQYPNTVGVPCVQVIIIGAFLFLIVYANYLIMFFIHTHKDSLQTCDLRFGFNCNHSTVLCTAIYMDTINYYVNEGSNVYSCLLNASKAFDIVHWGRLFKILIERKVPFLFIHLLLDSYLRQLSCVAWGFFKPRYFYLCTGVKQGGVLSPILFTLYIEKLLVRLKHAHIGCLMNNTFTGALSYADVITLFCPSICVINKMNYICCEYAQEYDIKFNPTKTVCIKYGDKVRLYKHVVMNGNTIEWADNVRHLGNFVDVALSDSLDCVDTSVQCLLDM